MKRTRFTILHTIQTGGPGGAENVVLNLAAGLRPDRFRSIVLCPDGSWLPAQLRERDIPVVLADSPRWFHPEMPRTMARLVRRENVDLIQSHLPGQNLYASLVARSLGRPAVVNYHGAVELQQSARWKRAVELWTVRHFAAAFVVVCDQMAGVLKQAGFPTNKILRIYNGIDAARFTARRGGRLRQELGLRPEQALVGMVANVRPPKGHDNFIRAARRVADRFPEARFVAAGDHLMGLSETLQVLVRELHLRDRFHFLGFRQDVPEILQDLDVFVLPSLNEGFPFAALEAMAASKPSVVTRCGGLEEIVDDGASGFLVPVADDAALADKICLLLSDPARAEAMGRVARETVLRLFRMDVMITQYEQLYERLLHGLPVHG